MELASFLFIDLGEVIAVFTQFGFAKVVLDVANLLIQRLDGVVDPIHAVFHGEVTSHEIRSESQRKLHVQLEWSEGAKPSQESEIRSDQVADAHESHCLETHLADELVVGQVFQGTLRLLVSEIGHGVLDAACFQDEGVFVARVVFGHS